MLGRSGHHRFCVRVIGLAKKKAALPVGHVEGTILQFFPGLWPSYDSAVLSLARKAKTLVVILAHGFL